MTIHLETTSVVSQSSDSTRTPSSLLLQNYLAIFQEASSMMPVENANLSFQTLEKATRKITSLRITLEEGRIYSFRKVLYSLPFPLQQLVIENKKDLEKRKLPDVLKTEENKKTILIRLQLILAKLEFFSLDFDELVDSTTSNDFLRFQIALSQKAPRFFSALSRGLFFGTSLGTMRTQTFYEKANKNPALFSKYLKEDRIDCLERWELRP